MSKKILIIIIVLILLAGLLLGIIFSGRILLNKTGYAFLGDEFMIDKSMPIQIIGQDFKIRIAEFNHSVCPDIDYCTLDSIEFEFTHQTDKIRKDYFEQDLQAFGFTIKVLETDFEEGAILQVIK